MTVQGIGALARLSERHDRPILAEEQGGRTRCSVEWDGVSYRDETAGGTGHREG